MSANRETAWILGISLALLALEAHAVAGWTAYGDVMELNPATTGRLLVRLDVASNPSGCRNKQWFYIDYGGRGVDFVFQTLLEASKADKKVRVYVTGSCDLQGYSRISSASLRP